MVNKRGRKRTNDLYFGPREEEAISQFLEATNDLEKNKIFNDILKVPLERMAELIIKKYKLYRKGFTIEEQVVDTVSFLITKAAKFKKAKGKRAYSYYGTICKNYNLGLIIKEDKMMKQTSSYEDVSHTIEERSDLSYVIDDDSFSMETFINNLIVGIQKELDDTTLPVKKRLNENERKIGEALIEVLGNWEVAFNNMAGGSKFAKNSVLETMRNYTNLSTKDMRVGMKRFKALYDILKLDILE